MKRVLDVARIHLVNWPLMLAGPLGILGIAFVLNLAIFASVLDAADLGIRVTGGLLSIYLVMAVTHLQTMTQVFPFAIGLGVTRRAFAAGTAGVIVAQSLLFGLVILLLERVEVATDGWGMRLRFFGLDFLREPNPLLQWLVYSVPLMTLAAVGSAYGVVFKRWGQLGVYAVSIGGAVLGAALAVLVTLQHAWPAVGQFVAGQPRLALLAGYPMAIAVLLGAASWLALRRATP